LITIKEHPISLSEGSRASFRKPSFFQKAELLSESRRKPSFFQKAARGEASFRKPPEVKLLSESRQR